MRNHRKHGHGTFTDADGTKWTGQWVRGLKHGMMDVERADGTTY